MQETEEAKKKKTAIRRELREKTAGYIVTALGLVAGLAWNDAISSFIKYFFPLGGGSLIAKLAYAILVTVIIVLLSQGLLRVLGSKEE